GRPVLAGPWGQRWREGTRRGYAPGRIEGQALLVIFAGAGHPATGKSNSPGRAKPSTCKRLGREPGAVGFRQNEPDPQIFRVLSRGDASRKISPRTKPAPSGAGFVGGSEQIPIASAFLGAARQIRRQEVAVRVVVRLQVLGQRLQVIRGEGAGGLLQTQVVEDVVVARIVVVAHRTVQLTLGVEHVDDVAGTDLVADLG